MKMKQIKYMIAISVVVLLVVGCKPSEKYAGDWLGVSDSGEEVSMHFDREEKQLTLVDSDGQEEVHDINQNSTGIKNSLQYFGIELGDDYYYVIFKNRKNEDEAEFVKQTNHASDFDDMAGETVFTMIRE